MIGAGAGRDRRRAGPAPLLDHTPDDRRARGALRYPAALLMAAAILLVACGADRDQSEADPVPAIVGEPATTSSSPADTTMAPSAADDGSGGTRPASPSTSSTATAVADNRSGPVFTPGSCPFRAPPDTDPTCGHVSVPENRDQPGGRHIRLAVAVFPARSSETYPPVVYLDGGPGAETLEAIPLAFEEQFAFLNDRRTVVLFDQRGVGYSGPDLSCPAMLELSYDLLDEDLPVEEVVERREAVLHACRRRWVDEGVDLSRYNSAESAADVADLRVALGYDRWDLYGVSYGTRLALTVMRDHPEGVRAVVLDSTYPLEIDAMATLLPNAARGLDELFSACASDPVCSSIYGDLETALFSLIEQLDASPAELWVLDPLAFEGYPALLDGDSFLGLVFQSLYADAFVPALPRLVADVRDGHYSGAQSLLSLFMANEYFFSIGQFLSVECHEEVPFSDRGRVRASQAAHPRLVSLIDGALAQSEYAFVFCPAWGAGTADPIESRPVVSEIPTLVMAGSFDPITPPEDGRRVAERLPNAWFVEFPTLSHGVASVEGCPRSITSAFLADPGTEPDMTCVAGMPAIRFDVMEPGAEIELVEDRVDGYTLPVPEEWSGGDGFYQRGLGNDPTSLLIIPGNAGMGETVLTMVTRTYSGSGIDIEEMERVTAGDRVWRRHSARAGGVTVEAALLEEAGRSIVVVLVCDTRERDHLVERVLLPVLQGFGPAGS